MFVILFDLTSHLILSNHNKQFSFFLSRLKNHLFFFFSLISNFFVRRFLGAPFLQCVMCSKSKVIIRTSDTEKGWHNFSFFPFNLTEGKVIICRFNKEKDNRRMVFLIRIIVVIAKRDITFLDRRYWFFSNCVFFLIGVKLRLWNYLVIIKL